MATLEKKRLVLRVAYAGPPLAGKTESIRALLRLLRGSGGERYVFSPGEARARTIFFDWAEYEAGTFQGNPIRCQITSVPGQAVLSSRREALVKAADAVVLVIDSRAEGLEDARRCYDEMSPWLTEAGHEAPVRVVLQCNKQDLEGSLSPEVLSQRLGLAVSSACATSAATGKGLRPAFIAAVREALARAQTLTDRGLIKFGRPEIDSGQELLERMQRDVAASETADDEREPHAAQAIAPEPPRGPVHVAPAPQAPPTPPVYVAPPPEAPPAPPVYVAPPPEAPPAPPVYVAPPPEAPPAPPVYVAPPPEAPPAPPVYVAPPAQAPSRDEPSTKGSDGNMGLVEVARPKARPAVMPASAFRAAYSAALRHGDPPAGASAPKLASVPRAPAPSHPPAPSPEAPSSTTEVAAPPQVPSSTSDVDGPSAKTVAANPGAITGAFGADARSRPAVMPATAYRLSLALAGLAPERHPLAPTRESAEVSTVIAEPGSPTVTRVAEAPANPSAPPAPFAATAIEQRMKSKGRPAVIPAAAFLAMLANTPLPIAEAGSSPIAHPALKINIGPDAPRLPSRGLPDDRVCPLAMWRALEPQMSALRAAPDARGGWHGEPAPGWYAHTIDSAGDYEAGRRLYEAAVNRHNNLYRYLSKERCLALTQEGNYCWWVWQVVRKVPTLAARLEHWPRAGDSPEAVAGALVDCAVGYLHALEAMKDSPEPLPLGLDKIAQQDGAFVYAGLVPRPGQESAAPADRHEALEDTLRSKLSRLPRPPMDVPAVLNALQNMASGQLPGPLVEMMCSVLIGH